MVKLRVEDSAFEALLQRHAGQIGYKPWRSCFADIFAAISFFISTVMSTGPAWLETFAVVFSLVYLALGVDQGFKAWKYGYSADQLMEDIRSMDTTEKHSSIMAIRSAERPGEYLLYHDTRWDCDFFPNYDTQGTAEMEKPNLKSWLVRDFSAPENLALSFITETSSMKPSLSHNSEMREYDYRLWLVDVDSLPDAWKSDTFTINGRNCRWESIPGMEANPRIMQVNQDVVSMVKDSIH
ncbi:hypothetical protein [uncultured Bifidobacterium sp.]|uniref:hypothetical protein n=1 Tax=uncultured Bifidobacterium sp. TaxID=165187 RepID=UPI002618FC9F|nr:hypothetical protein [uncultured Bifidobacterium sp.]